MLAEVKSEDFKKHKEGYKWEMIQKKVFSADW